MPDYEISQLTTGTPVSADLMAFVKVSDHSTPPAGAGGSDQKVTMASLAAVLAPLSGSLVTVPVSGDVTGATDTAAINAIVQAAGGGTAVLKNGTYYTTNLLPDSYGSIVGLGPGTILQAVSGTTGSMIALKTPATTQQVIIRDLTLIPNTGTLNGILLDNTGFTPAIFDSRHELRNVYVLSAGGDSFSLGANIRGAVITGCVQYWGTGYGFNIGSSATDNFITSCVSGHSGNHGFNLAGGNNLLSSCKAFWAGYNQGTGLWGTSQAGFYFPSTSTYNTLVGCSAQQNAFHGYDLQSALHCTLTGCESDSNSAGAGGGCGVNLNNATYCAIVGMSGQNNGSLSPGAQTYGMQVNGTLTGTVLIGNTVRGNSGGLNNLGGSGYTRVDGLSADFSNSQFLKLCSPVLSADGVQTLSNGYTILTGTDGAFGAVPLTATGATTGLVLQAPNNTWSLIALVNQSAFPHAFAASGTSNVAGGTSVIIPPSGSLLAIYDGNTSLWSCVNWATLPAGTASVAPLTFQSGTLLTSAAAGAAEYDGVSAYFTADTTSGRGAVGAWQQFRLTAAGSTISTIANYFGTTSNISLVANAEYEIEIDCWFLKTTAGTVTWTFTNSAAPTSMTIDYQLSPATGIVSTAAATDLFGQQYNVTATAPTVVSGSLTTAVNHRHRFWIRLINGTGTSLKIQATAGAGTITPGINSYWKARRVPAANVGTFAA